MKRNFLILVLVAPIVALMLIVFRRIPATKTLSMQQELVVPQTDSSIEETPPDEETITTRTFGYSQDGRAIEGYQFGNGNECLLFFAGIHGNEKGAIDMLRTLADAIIVQPNLVSSQKKVVIIPLLNPDGYSEDLYRTNANGVNLNRNFSTPGWIMNPDKETFAGTGPFSEAETRVLQSVVQECMPSSMIAFHSQGGVISPEGSPESIALGDWYASKTGYTIYNDWDYPGTATQWFTNTTGNPAITVEIQSHEKSDWEINERPLLDLISGKI